MRTNFNRNRLRLLLLPGLFLILGVVTLVSGQSNLSDDYDYLFKVVTIISFIVLLIVTGMFVVFILRFRENNTKVERKTISHVLAKKLEMGWTLVAILIIAALMAVSYPILSSLDHQTAEASSTAEDVLIEGTNNWQWFFHKDNVTYSPVLDENGVSVTTLPLKVGVEYNLIFWSSGNWIHSFYVPGLSFKMDVVPGSNNTFPIVIEKAGSYEVYCAEFCGAGHSAMRGMITAEL